MKVSVVSLGCKVNQSEGEEIIGRFEEAGIPRASSEETADIIIVNTCTVTGEADRKSRKMVYQAVKKKIKKRTVVAVTGCYAETAADTLRAIPGVDVVVPQHDKDGLAGEILKILNGRETGVPPHLDPLPAGERNDGTRHRAYIKIQDGCDNRCAYCIVPDARGKPRSLPVPGILKRTAELAAGGTKEVVLTGINIGKHDDLAGLIRQMQKTPELARIRLSSIESEDVTDELLGMTRFSNQGAYLCPHLHVPMQSGDERTLKRMRRLHTPAEYMETVSRIRAACPEVAITTDVIVGFPGETDDEFRNTFRFIEDFKPSRLHVFRFSKRPGTPAAAMPDQVAPEEKAERGEALRELSERLGSDYRKPFIGRELDVLVETAGGNRLTGTTENYLTVEFDGDKSLIGQLVKVRLER